MKLLTALWLAMWLTPVAGQDSAIDRPHQVMTFSYPMDSSWTMPLWTSRLRPEAKGAIRIARGSIAIDIDIHVDDLRPPQSLGGNFNTYVLWLISPTGELSNVGELLLNGNSGMLHTISNWGAFGVFVTAEPDNCVTCPSGPVVLANEVCVGGLPHERLATIECRNASIRCRDQ